MDFREQQAQIAGYKTEEIYWHLEHNTAAFGKAGIVLLCDQLLQRKQPIRFLSQHFERLVRDLPQVKLAFIERHDHTFSKASVQVAFKELRRRGKRVSEWFWHHDESQEGPLNREQIDQRIGAGHILPEHHLWKEGWEEWRKLEQLEFLTAKLYYEQDIPQRQQKQQYRPGGPPPFQGGQPSGSGPSSQGASTASSAHDYRPDKKTYSGLSITAGILTLIGFPIWLVIAIITPFSSYDEVTGLFLPAAFAVFMVLAAIPFGIGILMRKYWAWWSRLVTASIAVVWMISKIAFNDGSVGWMWLLLLEGIIGTFLLVSKEDFNRERI